MKKNKNILFAALIVIIFILVVLYSGTRQSIFEPTSPQFLGICDEAYEPWENTLTKSCDSYINGYNLKMIKQDRTTEVFCNTNSCGGTLKEKDSYGCDVWQTTISTPYYYYTYCAIHGTDSVCNNPSFDAVVPWQCTRKCYAPLPGTYGGFWTVAGYDSIVTTCGGANVVTNPGCSYKYQIIKDGIVKQQDQTGSLTAGIQFDDNNISITVGQNPAYTSHCVRYHNTFDIKVPSNAFTFSVTPGLPFYTQGDNATVLVTVNNLYKTVTGKIELEACQPTLFTQQCGIVYSDTKVIQKNSQSQFTLSIPTEFVAKQITLTPKIILTPTPAELEISGMNINKQYCINNPTSIYDVVPMSACSNINLGKFTGDSFSVQIKPNVQCQVSSDCEQFCIGVIASCVNQKCVYSGTCVGVPQQTDLWSSIAAIFNNIFNAIKNILGWR